MKIEIAEHGRMSESGSSLLRLIQNQSMPLLDLLVRESIQNSLDAAKHDEKCVNIDLIVGEFKSKELNKNFDKVEDALNSRFPSNQNYQFIAIKDSNTYGLTGPVSYEEVKNNNFGNMLKLVYEICKPQQNEGSGGSWGLGKTIYFRIGIGLVLYYTRIKENGKYVSKLAACLVEDETKNNTIIPSRSGVKRGIAWWGDSKGKNRTVPIRNTKEIERILSVFNIEPYSRNETGTTVIIPYINSEKLLNEVYAKNEDVDFKPFWTSSIEDYLAISIQRWYAPRYLNPHYTLGAYLSPSINGVKQTVQTMLPLFNLVRKLYILTFDNSIYTSFVDEFGTEPITENISIREVFINSGNAGSLSYVKMTNKQLLMTAPNNNKNPYQQITNCVIPMDDDRNTPIISFTRKPGMIVGYDFDGPWTHRMPRTKKDEYIIGIFIANSNNQMKDIVVSNAPLSFEEYIRQGEKADHSSWNDRNVSGTNPRAITKIQNGVIKKISNRFKEKNEDIEEKKNIGLGHALANILLPSTDFGRRPSPTRPHSKNGDNRSSTKKSSFSITNKPIYSNGLISIDYKICLKKDSILSLQVLADYNNFSANTWEKADEIGKVFPLEFINFTINNITLKNKPTNSQKVNLSLTKDNNHLDLPAFSVSLLKSTEFGSNSSIGFNVKEQCEILGNITFVTHDSSVKGSFNLKEIV